ncbi:hypothetical protein AVEN_218970-1 [Araneus ventricosus]|uniref:Uncharacterized protein n=1 Tax=Araneus ventricosus TaxID=182803 RepID=A0A4Y2CC48_ARAVE|nr:hypothetical protein AVEN_218970-1 [Araneus ventricosus]
MTALKFLMSCLFIITLNITISGGDNTSLPPRHISEFSDPISGFNPYLDLEEGFVNDSRPSIDRKLIENRRTNLLSAISMTESGRRMSEFFNEYEQSKIPNLRVYNSMNKTETIIKKLIAEESRQAKMPSERQLRVYESINSEESINKLIPDESQQVKMSSEKHLRVHDSIKNKESIINKLIPAESEKIRLTTANKEYETTENIITTNKDINENEKDDLEILNYLRKCKKSGIPNYRILINRKMKKKYKSSDTKIHFPAIVNSNAYMIYAIVCTIVIILIILYAALSLKRSPLLVK